MKNKIEILSFVFLLIFNLTGKIFLYGQVSNKYSREVEDDITKVENNLSGWIQAPGWQLVERMKFYHANGVSIAVIKDYRIQWAKGYGWADCKEGRPVTTTTLFQAGSISKSINAFGILKLAQENKINLYTDINKYLKSWKFKYDSLAKDRKITTANLLSHTAGLTVHGFPGYKKGEITPTLIQILDGNEPANTLPIRSMYEPSLKFEYSGGGTTISQLILQDVSGGSYKKYIRENIFTPLTMAYSFYTQPPSDMKNLLATGYDNDGNEIEGKYNIYPELAAAGLWTNPSDLARFVIEIHNR